MDVYKSFGTVYSSYHNLYCGLVSYFDFSIKSILRIMALNLRIIYLLFSVPFVFQGVVLARITKINSDPIPYAITWRSEVREARQAVANQLQNNLITTLNGLANSGLQHSANVTKALATLTTAVTRNTFDLVGVVGYLPKLMGQDLPTQFVQILRRIRSNEIRAPTDVDSAIDTVLAMVKQAEESGITENLFGPTTRSNLLTGANDFLAVIFSSMFGLLGAS